MGYFSIKDDKVFQKEHKHWIATELTSKALSGNRDWSESIAVGRKSFAADIQQQLGSRSQNRSIVSANGTTVLKEPEISYNSVFDDKKSILSSGNTYFLEANV